MQEGRAGSMKKKAEFGIVFGVFLKGNGLSISQEFLAGFLFFFFSFCSVLLSQTVVSQVCTFTLDK